MTVSCLDNMKGKPCEYLWAFYDLYWISLQVLWRNLSSEEGSAAVPPKIVLQYLDIKASNLIDASYSHFHVPRPSHSSL